MKEGGKMGNSMEEEYILMLMEEYDRVNGRKEKELFGLID